MLAISFNWVITSTGEAADHPSDFVGSGRCIECHQQEYADWRQSDHRKAMQPANKNNVLGDFDNVTVEFHGIETRLFRQGNNFKITTTGQHGNRRDFQIKYTFGHYPLQQYLVDIGKGHLQALNIAWDSRSAVEGGSAGFTCKPTKISIPSIHSSGPNIFRIQTVAVSSATVQTFAKTSNRKIRAMKQAGRKQVSAASPVMGPPHNMWLSRLPAK